MRGVVTGLLGLEMGSSRHTKCPVETVARDLALSSRRESAPRGADRNTQP